MVDVFNGVCLMHGFAYGVHDYGFCMDGIDAWKRLCIRGYLVERTGISTCGAGASTILERDG